MDIFESIKKRRSIRKFIPVKIPGDVLTDIIDCARFAPTAFNEQPCRFVVIVKEERLQKIASLTDHGKFIAAAAACVAVFADSSARYPLMDGCAAIQNILLGAFGHRVASCWVGCHRKNFSHLVACELNAPPCFELIALVALGYAAEKSKITKRPLTELMFWETF